MVIIVPSRGFCGCKEKKTFRMGRGNLNIKTNLMSMFENSNHCHKCMMMSRTTASFRIHFTKKSAWPISLCKIWQN